MEGSIVNTTTNSIINDKGLLESVEQKIISIMETQNMGNNGNDEETDLLYSSVYDKNNQISFSDIEEINNNTNQNIDFGISDLITINSQIINLSDYFINENINKKIYSYFDNFTYEKYNESNYNSYTENIEEEEDEYENKNEDNNKRNLNQEIAYYGMKKITQVKPLYNYNLIGLRMEKQIFIENDPSTGIVSLYTISIFGNRNTKIKSGENYSNLHIIIEKKIKWAII